MSVSTPGVETPLAESWITNRIRNDATLAGLGTHASYPEFVADVGERVYQWVAPEETPSPYIILSQQGATDLVPLGGTRIWAQLDYLLVVVASLSEWAPISPIADRLDALFHVEGALGAAGVIAAADGIQAGRVHETRRVRPFALPEVVAGKQYRRLGGIYRLRVSAGS